MSGQKYARLDQGVVTDLANMFSDALRISMAMHPSGEVPVKAAFPVAIRLMWEHYVRTISPADLLMIEEAALEVADDLGWTPKKESKQ